MWLACSGDPVKAAIRYELMIDLGQVSRVEMQVVVSVLAGLRVLNGYENDRLLEMELEFSFRRDLHGRSLLTVFSK